MTLLVWDGTGERFFETGVDHGVLYVMDETGDYPLGVPWNGLISINETPAGGEPTDLFADNMKYLTLVSAETLGLTIEAYTYPDEFGACDGSAEPEVGMKIYQQGRKTFGLVYRTKIGNDVLGADLGYIYHLVYGCVAKPSERAYQTVNDSPEANTFSWEVATTPPSALPGFKPTSLITVDSRTCPAPNLAALLDELFGAAAITAHLPTQAEVLALVEGA